METSQGMNPMMMMMAMMNGNGPTNMSDIPPMMGGAMPNMDGNPWANSPNPMPNDMPQGMNPMMMMRMMQGGNGGMPPMNPMAMMMNGMGQPGAQNMGEPSDPAEIEEMIKMVCSRDQELNALSQKTEIKNALQTYFSISNPVERKEVLDTLLQDEKFRSFFDKVNEKMDQLNMANMMGQMMQPGDGFNPTYGMGGPGGMGGGGGFGRGGFGGGPETMMFM